MSKEFISASEIAEYLYCERSWWYRLQGILPSASASKVMKDGTEAHEVFAKEVQRVSAQSRLASRLLWLGTALFVVVVLLKLVSGQT